MDIDITRFFTAECPRDYSASVAEIGDDAGPATWQAANEAAPQYPDLLGDELARDAFRRFARSSGGWNDEEIAAWTDTELTALFIQWISGDMREAGLDVEAPDWQQYEADATAGQCSGNIWRAEDGRVYFCLEG